MRAIHPPWLVVAVSGRMLAASARRGGHQAVVLDCFADRDTMAVAVQARSVSRGGMPHIDARALLHAAADLAPSARVPGLVCGSGFEARTGLLTRLAAGRELHGNPARVVAEVKDPARFFPLLDRLGVAHPEVRLAPPPDPEGWLVKRAGGAGGTHVRPARRRRAAAGCYFQRQEEGRSLSVLFLASGRDARVLGCSRQWTAGVAALPFLYGGAASHVQLPPKLARRVEAIVTELVSVTGLVGLNGLDFLLRDDEPLVLELNPRPTSTMELYDPDWDRGLFDAHLLACRGELPPALPPFRESRAAAIQLAPSDWQCPADLPFPDWCSDLPWPGTRIAAGQPICTVHAAGPGPEAAHAAVTRRQVELGEALSVGLLPVESR